MTSTSPPATPDIDPNTTHLSPGKHEPMTATIPATNPNNTINPNTTVTKTPNTGTPTDLDAPMSANESGGRVRLDNVIHGEWIKFWSVRSTSITLVAAAFATVFFGMIFSWTVGSDEPAPGPGFGLTDPIDVALGGINMAEMIIGVLGVILVTTEYSTGLIRTAFAAVGRRTNVLRAKAAVLTASVIGVMSVGVLGALWAGQAVYGGTEPTLSMTDPELWGVAAGAVAYLVGIGLIGLALGFMLRSASGAIGSLFGGIFIGPQLMQLLPDSFTDAVLKYLPSEAGTAMMSRVNDPDLLSTGTAYVVFGAWVFGFLGIAAAMLRRRDA